MLIKHKKYKADYKINKNIIILTFIVISILLSFGWKCLDLPHDTVFQFAIRSITISILSLLITWLIIRLFK